MSPEQWSAILDMFKLLDTHVNENTLMICAVVIIFWLLTSFFMTFLYLKLRSIEKRLIK